MTVVESVCPLCNRGDQVIGGERIFLFLRTSQEARADNEKRMRDDAQRLALQSGDKFAALRIDPIFLREVSKIIH